MYHMKETDEMHVIDNISISQYIVLQINQWESRIVIKYECLSLQRCTSPFFQEYFSQKTNCQMSLK